MQDVLQTFRKAPGDTLDYGIDWLARTNAIAAGKPASVLASLSDYLEAGETILTSAWTADEGLTVGESSIGTGVTKVWLSGGTDGTEYLVTNVITTSVVGRTVVRLIRLIVRS